MQEVACYDPSLYCGSGVFTIAHIDPSPRDVGITHRARMRRGASPVALRRRSMQYPEYRVLRMHLLLIGSWVISLFGCAGLRSVSSCRARTWLAPQERRRREALL